MVGSLKTVGMVALPSDVSAGLTPDQGKRIRYEASLQATAVAEMADDGRGPPLPACTPF